VTKKLEEQNTGGRCTKNELMNEMRRNNAQAGLQMLVPKTLTIVVRKDASQR
jgi:hypothetical protein